MIEIENFFTFAAIIVFLLSNKNQQLSQIFLKLQYCANSFALDWILRNCNGYIKNGLEQGLNVLGKKFIFAYSTTVYLVYVC